MNDPPGFRVASDGSVPNGSPDDPNLWSLGHDPHADVTLPTGISSDGLRPIRDGSNPFDLLGERRANADPIPSFDGGSLPPHATSFLFPRMTEPRFSWSGLLDNGDERNADGDQEDRQEALSQGLAVALTGNVPALGLKLYEAVKVTRVSANQKPLLQFGRWACDHLAQGGGRDATFVARGAEMLRASLLPNFFWGGNRTEPALWLKAIYWDSGIARTPEEAIARAYDSMPGVKRPDFVPR